jgi:hypothetical protein
VDLDDDQVLDLIDTAGLPFEGSWPCLRDEAVPCGECRQCRRWRRAAGALHLDWPWATADDPAGARELSDGRDEGPGAQIEVVGRVRGGRSEPVVLPAAGPSGGPSAGAGREAD